jgi:hypothetical protein
MATMLRRYRLECTAERPLADIGAPGIRDTLGLRHSPEAVMVLLSHPDRDPQTGLCRWCNAATDSLHPVF